MFFLDSNRLDCFRLRSSIYLRFSDFVIIKPPKIINRLLSSLFNQFLKKKIIKIKKVMRQSPLNQQTIVKQSCFIFDCYATHLFISSVLSSLLFFSISSLHPISIPSTFIKKNKKLSIIFTQKKTTKKIRTKKPKIFFLLQHFSRSSRSPRRSRSPRGRSRSRSPRDYR